MFSAGRLTSPMPTDERFGEYADAEKAAIAGSLDDDVWAAGEVRAVVYQQIVYLP